MDIVDIALYKLKHDGINARREDNHIVWNDDFNDEYSIFEHEIAYSDGKMAFNRAIRTGFYFVYFLMENILAGNR